VLLYESKRGYQLASKIFEEDINAYDAFEEKNS
jgi:hypothetical protein